MEQEWMTIFVVKEHSLAWETLKQKRPINSGQIILCSDEVFASFRDDVLTFSWPRPQSEKLLRSILRKADYEKTKSAIHREGTESHDSNRE